MLPKVLTKHSGSSQKLGTGASRTEQFIFGFQCGAFGGKGTLLKSCETQLENDVYVLSFHYFQAAISDILQQEQQRCLFIVWPVDQTAQGL